MEKITDKASENRRKHSKQYQKNLRTEMKAAGKVSVTVFIKQSTNEKFRRALSDNENRQIALGEMLDEYVDMITCAESIQIQTPYDDHKTTNQPNKKSKYISGTISPELDKKLKLISIYTDTNRKQIVIDALEKYCDERGFKSNEHHRSENNPANSRSL